MAYSEKYYAQHFSNGGVPFHISLQKEGFVGTATRFNLVKGGVKLNYGLGTWEDNVMTLTAQLGVLNEAADWYTYEDLMTLENKEFKLVINASYGSENITLFDGWLNSSPVVQQYLNNAVINLTGSNFIQKMDKLSPAILSQQDASNGDAISLIDLINSSLQLTGKNDDILVNSTLEPSSGLISNTTTLYNKCAVNPQLFFANNTNKESGLAILNEILTPLNGYLYWWNGDWYLERYRDLAPADGSKGYVRYAYPTPDVSFKYGNEGVLDLKVETSTNLPIDICPSNQVFTEKSQTINMIPGLEFLEIELDESEVLNLTINDFKNMGTGSFPAVHYPGYRKWDRTKLTRSGVTGWQFDGFNPAYAGVPYRGIQNSLRRTGAPIYYVNDVPNQTNKNYGGFSTRFKLTVSNTDTILKIKWKFSPDRGTLADYRANYTLRVPTGSNWLTQTKDASGTWFYHNSNTFNNYVNYATLNGSDLNAQNVGEFSVDIPVGDVSGWITSGNTELIFSILIEDAKPTTKTDFTADPASYLTMAYYGDVEITAVSGLEKDNNKIIAQLNKNVLNSQKTEFKLYDQASLMLDNGIQTGNNFGVRTDVWKERNDSTYRSLIHWYIHDRYQLYNRNRKELTGSLKYTGYLKPMSIWYDNIDPSTTKYILSSYTYNLDQDRYDCGWLEYDNTSVINLSYGDEAPAVVPAAATPSRRPSGSSSTSSSGSSSTSSRRGESSTSSSGGRRR